MVKITVTLVEETCCTCGVMFGLEKEHRRRLIDTGVKFYCPNGHPQQYAPTKEELLQKKLDQAVTNNLSCLRRLEYTERSRDAYKGHYNRIKKVLDPLKEDCEA